MSKAKIKNKRRQQRQLERRKAKRASVPNPIRMVKGRRRRIAPGLQAFTDEDQIFWLAHGANYIASDYDQGIWDPLLEDLYYAGEQGITSDRLVEAVSSRFLANEDDELSDIGKAILAWTTQSKETVYLLSREAVRAVRKADPRCNSKETSRHPANPAVWQVFHEIKNQVLRGPA